MKLMWSKNKRGIAAFVLPIGLLLIIYAVWGQYPFGEHTLLIWDMNWQYCSFFSHLHDILHGDASAVYSFSRAYGGDMIGVMAYYLMSPFNLLFYFFDAAHIYIGILLVTMLKTGCTGFTMFLFLNRKEQFQGLIFFSTAYALSAYVIAYQYNLMWMDALIVLPLMIWGIEQLVDSGKYLLYIIMIALAVTTNFYTGYILCLFSVIYFLFYFLLISEQKKYFKVVIQYAGCSLLGGALSAWMILPTLYALEGGKSSFDLNTIKLLLGNYSRITDVAAFLQAGFMGTIHSEQISGGGLLIYGGTFCLLLTGYWFLYGKAKVRRKAAYAALLLILLLSMRLQNLNYIWHAMAAPMGAPHRFSFLYIFVLVTVAAMGYQTLCTDRRARCILLAIGLIMLAVLISQRHAVEFTERKGLFFINCVLIVCYVSILWMRGWSERHCIRNIANIMFAVLVCGELILNAEYLYFNTNQYNSPDAKTYTSYIENIEELLAEIPPTEEFYRIVLAKDAQWSVNDPFLFNFYGLDSYTSVEKQNVQTLAQNLGYENNIVFGAHYSDGSTMAAETLLGVKYLIAAEPVGEEYDFVSKNNIYSLYKNQNALPLGILTEDSVLTISEDDKNPFLYVDRLYQSMTEDAKDSIFQKITVTQTQTENVCRMEDGGYQRANSSCDAYIDYVIDADKNNLCYLFYAGAGVENAELNTAEKTKSFSNQSSAVKRLGRLKADDHAVIRVYIGEQETFYPDKLCVYEELENVLEEYAKEIQNQMVDVVMEKENDITIIYDNSDAAKKYLFFTIPYDRGWSVTVDGEKAIVYDAQNCIAVEAPLGKHEVKLSFRPRGFVPGIFITGMAVCICVGIFQRKKKNYSSDF